MPIIPISGSAAARGALVPIASALVPTNGYVAFNNIPLIYQDLKIVISMRDTASTGYLVWYVKESTYGYSSTDCSYTSLWSTGGAGGSNRATNVGRFTSSSIGSNALSQIFSTTTIDILDYANTSFFKTYIQKNGGDQYYNGFWEQQTGTWRKLDAINQLGFFTSSNGSTGFAPGSTAYLYGVRAVNQ
jgi:hypothetical protein